MDRALASQTLKRKAKQSNTESSNEVSRPPRKQYRRTTAPKGNEGPTSTSSGITSSSRLQDDLEQAVLREVDEVERVRKYLPTFGSIRTLLSWLIDLKKIGNNTEVHYVDPIQRELIKVGDISRSGIKCRCCSKTYSVWSFENHAHKTSLQQPYDNIIVLETGRSLTAYLTEAWDLVKPNDDFGTTYPGSREDGFDNACIVCADGGNLMCCDGCSSTYHHTCMSMETVPAGEWYCPYCICKFCECHHGVNDEFYTCFQCEKKFHLYCAPGEIKRCEERETVVADMNNPLLVVFCDSSCKSVYDYLQETVGKKHTILKTLSWSVIRRMHPRVGAYTRDPHQQLECNTKSFLAWSLLDEGFEAFRDNLTGVDVIHNIALNCGFRSNYSRLNHSGFYTVILEKKDEIVGVATIRTNGTKFAEMPFFTTHVKHRGKNMGRKLITAVNGFLRKLSIEYQTIPSIRNLEGMWRSKFRFGSIGHEMLKEMSQWNSVMVHSTVRLYRSLLSKAELLKKEENYTADALGNGGNHHHASSLTGPSSSSARPDHQPSSAAGTSTSSAKLDENQGRPMPDHQPSSAAGTSTSSAKLDESRAIDQEQRLVLDHEPSSATGAANQANNKKQLIPDLNEVYVPIDLNEKPIASEEEEEER